MSERAEEAGHGAQGHGPTCHRAGWLTHSAGGQTKSSSGEMSQLHAGAEIRYARLTMLGFSTSTHPHDTEAAGKQPRAVPRPVPDRVRVPPGWLWVDMGTTPAQAPFSRTATSPPLKSLLTINGKKEKAKASGLLCDKRYTSS